jgi:type I restriction enzyme, S subunit
MTDIPPGWVLARLGDVADWGSGGTPKSGDPRYYGGDIPWAVIGDLNDSVVYDTMTCITEDALKNSSAKMVPAGTLLIAMYGSIGKLGIAGRSMATNQAIAHARPRKGLIDGKFLFWYLRREKNQLAAAGKGATQQNIGQGVLKDWSIPIPPLAEQRRIVAALEDHLARFDLGRQAVHDAAHRLPLLWRSVLDRLYSGRLAGRTETLSFRPIRDVAEVSGGIQKQGKRAPVKNKYPFLRVANVGRGKMHLTEVHEVELFSGELERYLLKTGDLLVVEGNGSPDQIGRGARWQGQIRECVHQNHLIRVRPGIELIPEFLELVWSSPSVAGQLRDVARSTSGLYTLSTAKIKDIRIPVPSRADQRTLVETAEEWRGKCDRLHDSLRTVQVKTNSARNALLMEAFAGRLVPQDPIDEPAGMLLGKIRAEQARAPKAKRRPRTTAATQTELGMDL